MNENDPVPPRISPMFMGIWRGTNAAVICLIAVIFFLAPAVTVIHQLSDSGLRTGGMPHSAWKFHQSLSDRIEPWARARIDSKRAANLSIDDISGTEWPLFGSAFYLWATVSLQDEWEKSHPPGVVAPNIYARGAIDAVTKLVVDPWQASWVKDHWGTNYLHTEDVFYRMLVIAALTSDARLTEDKQYLPLLKDQADSLAAELGASPFGLLDDYPGQCYPGDVLTAIAMIHRADQVLGTDHSAFITRAIRGFQNQALDPRGLVPYFADAPRGRPDDLSRGCGNSYVSLFAPEIWPAQARTWYDLYSHYYWQERWTCAGFREFPNDLPGNEWYADVDSGLVLKGFGCSACAFGVGAARVNGHFEQAYPLTAEMLVTSWPLPNGTRWLPRLFSNATDAPFLGEAAVLFNLTRMPAAGVPLKTGGSIPPFVLIFLGLQLGIGMVLILAARRQWRQPGNPLAYNRPEIQFGIWLALLAGFAACLFLGYGLVATLLLAVSQLLPRSRRMRATSPAAASMPGGFKPETLAPRTETPK